MDKPQFLDCGFGHYVNVDSIVAVIKAETALARKLLIANRGTSNLLDFTGKYPIKGVIVTTSGILIRTMRRPIDIARDANNIDKTSNFTVQ